MNKLIELINRITEFGLKDKVNSENKELEICRLLVNLYSEYLNSNPEFDDNGFEEEPSFDYYGIRQNVESNFPKFGLYHSIWGSNKIYPDADLTTGDAIDDLTDIIKDLLEVKWCYENTSLKNAEWHFCNLMKIHSEQHLVNFIKYL